MRIFRLDSNKPWQDQDFGGKRFGKTVCVQRYGGFGDMLQVSSILPGLKEQGYSVTLNVTPEGFDIIREDPHIDAVFIQEHDQVPNAELGFYWDKLSSCFDKFIMLSESVEGALLALPDRRESAWHPDFRRMVMGNVNYIEATHAIAEVPMPPKTRFYPTKKGIKKARKYRKELGEDNFVIMWALSGSAVHKTWPYLDAILARLMIKFLDVKVVLCGDKLSQILENGWEGEERVIATSGKWGIRETLTFAEQCDLVIGPETGVLNSVSMLDMPKILMLSHSSFKNIGINWLNTVAVEPVDTPCYPCHILHRGFELCHRDDTTGTALCASSIAVDIIWNLICDVIGAKP